MKEEEFEQIKLRYGIFSRTFRANSTSKELDRIWKKLNASSIDVFGDNLDILFGLITLSHITLLKKIEKYMSENRLYFNCFARNNFLCIKQCLDLSRHPKEKIQMLYKFMDLRSFHVWIFSSKYAHIVLDIINKNPENRCYHGKNMSALRLAFHDRKLQFNGDINVIYYNVNPYGWSDHISIFFTNLSILYKYRHLICSKCSFNDLDVILRTEQSSYYINGGNVVDYVNMYIKIRSDAIKTLDMTYEILKFSSLKKLLYAGASEEKLPDKYKQKIIKRKTNQNNLFIYIEVGTSPCTSLIISEMTLVY